MKYIYEIRSKRDMAAPGVWGYEAEAKVAGPDSVEEIFVFATNYLSNSLYVVDSTSVMDEHNGGEMTPEEEAEIDEMVRKVQAGEDLGEVGSDSPYMEQYEKLSDAKASAYYPVFKALNDVLKAMEKEIG